VFRNRSSLLWLLAPFILYIGALPWVNRVHPLVLGMPFFLFWMLLATLLTPLTIYLAARGDPAWQADREGADREGADPPDEPQLPDTSGKAAKR
jgi:hypothetical protein